MRDQYKIYVQGYTPFNRNKAIQNVNMSSDIDIISLPLFNLSGATKILETEYKTDDMGGVDFHTMLTTSIDDCFSGNTTCISGISWDLMFYGDGNTIYSQNLTATTDINQLVTQEMVNSGIETGLQAIDCEFTKTGDTFTIAKPHGVGSFSIELCLDVNKVGGCGITYICPDGYYSNPDGTKCVKYETTGSTIINLSGLTNIKLSGGPQDNTYGFYGTTFLDTLNKALLPIKCGIDSANFNSAFTYNNDSAISVIAQIPQDTLNQPFWYQTGETIGSSGRLVQSCVSPTNIPSEYTANTWFSTSICVDLDEPKTYYIGMGADNYSHFYIDGVKVVDYRVSNTANFRFWNVFPWDFDAGHHIIEIAGANANDIFTFGFEIYTATSVSALTGMTASTMPNAKLIETTKNNIGDKLLSVYQDGLPGNATSKTVVLGYSCPSGYALSCDDVHTCEKSTYTTGTTIPLYTADCQLLCSVLSDNIYTTLDSGSTGVYIVNTAKTIDLIFQFTGNTNTLLNTSGEFAYDIHRLNDGSLLFSDIISFKSLNIPYTSITGTYTVSQSIPLSGIGYDGDFIVKGYYNFDYTTDFFSKIPVRASSVSDAVLPYGNYDKDTDYYFVVVKEAGKPVINNGNYITSEYGTLKSKVYQPAYNGQTNFMFDANYIGTPIITLNGLALVNGFDYAISGSPKNIIVSEGLQTTDVLTSIYVIGGDVNNGFTTDNIIVTGITSGSTNNQANNTVYFNTTSGKYELYTSNDITSGNDIIVSLNGLILANNVDYYLSTNNKKRVILNGTILVGDILNIYYNCGIAYVGAVSDSYIMVSWSIPEIPTNTDGSFTVELYDYSDTNHTTIINSVIVPYTANVSYYYTPLTISGSYGDKFRYRVKNEKYRVSLNGDRIYSSTYSDDVVIELNTNKGNAY